LENLDKLKTKLEFSEKAGKKVLEVGSSCLPDQLEDALASIRVKELVALQTSSCSAIAEYVAVRTAFMIMGLSGCEERE
jgi:hypothetical protein